MTPGCQGDPDLGRPLGKRPAGVAKTACYLLQLLPVTSLSSVYVSSYSLDPYPRIVTYSRLRPLDKYIPTRCFYGRSKWCECCRTI
jgi:hypothetical protein